MKTRGMMVAIVVGCLMAGVAGAQVTPGMSGTPKAGQTKKGMMAEGMMKQCQAMTAERKDMMKKMDAMDERADQLVAPMNAAEGAHRVDAMGAVIVELVAQHKAMRAMQVGMEGRMMSHMMEHMSPSMMESMATCPMMKEMGAMAPKASTTGKGDHAGHP